MASMVGGGPTSAERLTGGAQAPEGPTRVRGGIEPNPSGLKTGGIGRARQEGRIQQKQVRETAMAKAARARHVPQKVRENIRGEKAFGPGVQNFKNPAESFIGRGGP